MDKSQTRPLREVKQDLFQTHVVLPKYKDATIVLVICGVISVFSAYGMMRKLGTQTGSILCTEFTYILGLTLIIDVVITQQIFLLLVLAMRYLLVNDSQTASTIFSELHPLQRESRRTKIKDEFYIATGDDIFAANSAQEAAAVAAVE